MNAVTDAAGATASTQRPAFNIPLIIRGRVIDEPVLRFGGRAGGAEFFTAEVTDYLKDLVLDTPSSLADLYTLNVEDILDYLHNLGKALEYDSNPHMREACELSYLSSGLTKETTLKFYKSVHRWFDRDFIRELTENGVGLAYLDGWVRKEMATGAVTHVRAFGARNIQIISGNVPMVAASSIIRNAMTRSDAIIKTPSNDPMTAAAIARTMCEMAPDHPVTKHLTVAYWKGGNAAIEDHLYRPDHIEKIIAWGGVGSISHIAKYIQPGIDLITMDPKLSSSIIGAEAFADDDTMRAVAERLAIDVACYNQQACANARVVYVQSGTDKAGTDRLTRFGQMVYEAIQALPVDTSGPAQRLPSQLAEELQSLKIMSFDHKLIGGGPEGGVIVSQVPEPVDFQSILSDRVTNLVPVDDFEIPIQSVTAYTQTIGVYPDAVKEKIRDRLVFNGAQRIVSLGYAMRATMAGPHDGMEPYRRMVKWISDETQDPAVVPLHV